MRLDESRRGGQKWPRHIYLLSMRLHVLWLNRAQRPPGRGRSYDTRERNSARRDCQIDTMTNLASSVSTSRRQIIAYWVTTALVVFELALGGAWDVLRVPHVRGLIERLGYPPYFLVILGIWKLLGAVALVMPRFPRLKEWAYAGVLFDLTGAVASLWASGLADAGTMAYPIVMTGVAIASWALRPSSRRLPAR